MCQYITGDKAHLLEIGFEFIDEDEIYQISKHDIHEAEKTGEFYHPDRGELVDEYEKNIYTYFTLSDQCKGIRK